MSVRVGEGLNSWKFAFQQPEVQRQVENGNAPAEIRVRIPGSGSEQQDVAANHPRRGKVHVLPALGEVCHQRPKVYQTFRECLVRTGSSLDPLYLHAGALRRFIDNLDCKAGESVLVANLKR